MPTKTPEATAPEPARPPRADARRNRNAILAAARKVFGQRGLDAPLDAIAREAGVSRATQHRHFPNRDTLFKAIFDDNIDRIEQTVRETPDPSDAFVRVLLLTAQMLESDRSFVEMFDRRTTSEEVKREIASRFLASVEEPLRRAQEAGKVRTDLRADDTLLLLDMIAAAGHPPGPGRPPDRTDRGFALLLEAIRARRGAIPLDAPSHIGDRPSR
jgi:AcrR family transcriptional regulator